MKAAVALVLGLGLFAGAGCGDRGPSKPGPAALAEPPGPLEVFLSGDTRGFIVPCGCTTKQYGGLPRRATFLEKHAARGTLYVDAGGSFHRAFDYDRLKGEYLWRGMALLGIAAANLGASEIAQGRDYLRGHAAGLPFVSTNVLAADTGRPVVAPEIRVMRSGARIALLGVCSTVYPAGAGLRVDDPREALRAPIARLRGESDLLLLLAQAPEEELVGLAQSFPELDAVLGTGPSQPIPPREVEGRTVLAAASNKGKFLVEIPWTPSGSPPRWTAAQGGVIELSEAYPDHPAQVGILKEYQEGLRKAALAPDRTGEAEPLLAGLPPGYRYAGSAVCTTCHTPEGRIWQASGHGHGFETLKSKGFEADPFCLRCHTTGYGGPGGYRSGFETPLLGGVGCENCHGPSQAHASAPLRSRTPARAFDACVKCHDPENSPAFQVAEYWPRILHGKGRAPVAAPKEGVSPR